MATNTTISRALAPPWSAFVAAFLYYTLLTLLLVGGAQPSDVAVGVAYTLPIVALGGLLVTRGVRAPRGGAGRHRPHPRGPHLLGPARLRPRAAEVVRPSERG